MKINYLFQNLAYMKIINSNKIHRHINQPKVNVKFTYFVLYLIDIGLYLKQVFSG